MSSNCIFCKIISGESPGEILHQDDQVMVFKDIKPASKHHYLSVPRQHIININYLKSAEHKDLRKESKLFNMDVVKIYFSSC